MKCMLNVFVGILLSGTTVFAANGNLYVAGNLGLDTQTPSNILQVGASTNTGIDIGQPGDGMNTNIPLGGEAGQYDLRFYGYRDVAPNQIGSKISAIRINIWQPNSAMLQGMDLAFYTTNSGGIFTGNFQDNSIERMRINNAGNVGIGTATPAYTLDVNGTIRGSNVSPSDARFKKNLLPITTPLDKVLGMNGHSYEWKTDEYKDKNFPNGRHFGVIAQEIEKILPEVVNTDAKGEKSVAYTEIIPVLIEAIKEQQKRIDLLEKKLSQMRQ
jgi:uncharacterized protein YlzI (FlbEa/FlbD family)